MSQENSPSYLNREAIIGVEQALHEAVVEVSQHVEDYGFRARYKLEYEAFPPEVRAIIRRVGSSIHPYNGEGDFSHPRAAAIEYGLTFGVVLGYRALEDGLPDEQEAFADTFVKDLTSLYEFAYETPGERRYDIDDMFQRSGGEMADFLRQAALTSLLGPFTGKNEQPKVDDDNNRLCVDAMGYAFSGAKAILLYDAMYHHRTDDCAAEVALQEAIGQIGEISGTTRDGNIPASVLFPDLFPQE